MCVREWADRMQPVRPMRRRSFASSRGGDHPIRDIHDVQCDRSEAWSCPGPGRAGRNMFQIRIHGRGGQGVVTAAELLSVAALVEGSDLTVRDQRLYLKTLQGLEPVHGLLKRLDDLDWIAEAVRRSGAD